MMVQQMTAKNLSLPKVYNFNAESLLSSNKPLYCFCSLSIRPTLDNSRPISITVSFSNMFPKDLQPEGEAKFSLQLFSPLRDNPELIEKSE